MIRRAEPQDAAAIAAIWNQIIRDTSITFTTQEKSHADIVALLETRPVWVTEDCAGFALYGPFRSGPGYAHTVEHSIHLAPEARGSGAASALMDAVTDHATRAGHHSLIAGLAGDNARARRFHEKHGFTQVALIPEAGWKFGKWHDLLLMQKFLCSAAPGNR